jgi:brefeldin A-resistance guanine nucleotide exchange factor 1
LDNVISPNVLVKEHVSTRHSYYYADGRKEDSVNALLNAFTVLRAQLHDAGSVRAVPQPLLLLPFLRVILSPRTTGPVTSIALQAVYRLLVNDVVTAPSDTLDVEIVATRQDARDATTYLHRSSSQLAIAEIAHAVSHCQFEASDAVADELVLLRILAVMRELICYEGVTGAAAKSKQAGQPLADYLSDESVCEMMETGLSMCCQMRLSDLLRRTAEQSVTTMVRALFAKLSSIPLTADEAYSADPGVPQAEPEHATLAAEPVGEDAIEAENRKLRRITMPDPTSLDVPAAGISTTSVLQELKSIGEREGDGDEGGEEAVRRRLDSGDREQSAVEADDIAVQTPLLSEAAAEEELVEVNVQHYGLPAIKEVLRVIISLLDLQNQQHTDAMRLLGMSMLSAVFEVAGDAMDRFPSLRALIQDSACKHLFALAKSENPNLDGPCLRTMSTLFQVMPAHLKLQYELFLSHLLEKLTPYVPMPSEPWNEESSLARRPSSKDTKRGADTPDIVKEGVAGPPSVPQPNSPNRAVAAQGEARELYLETLGLLLGLHFPQNAFADRFVDLWINYDCDVDCENMLERTLKSLCRNVYAASPIHPHVQEGSQVLALDALLKFVGNMAYRYEGAGSIGNGRGHWPREMPSEDDLAAQKQTKASILAGAAKFNEKPKNGLQYFEEVGFISSRSQVSEYEYHQSIASFLKGCPGLDKKLLGDYLSRPNNEGILEAFLSLFDFSNTPIAEAMREMLEAFRLPGESQQIARITETFAKIYFAGQPSGIKNEDAVYVLSYSIIMLNTDLHNPQNKRRMTNEDYRRNLRGVNDGQDFGSEFLDAIYDSIRRREIVMPEEHKGQLGFEYAWKELLRRSRKCGDLHSAPTSHFDRTIFTTCWRPIVASIAHAFSTFRDEHLLERAITGFRQCAMLASQFGMNEIFDYLVNALASATGLLDSNGAGQVTNNATVDIEGQRISVSPLSIQFGRNFKGQLAAVVLFTIANGNSHAIQTGWMPIFEICKNLFINSLLTKELTNMFEFGDSPEPKSLPIKAKRAPGPPPQDPRSQSGVGIFSTISSYLLSPYTNEKEITRPDVAVNEEAVELTLCTIDCVNSCRVDTLFAILHQLNDQSRAGALQALRQLADRYTVERRAALISDGHTSGNDSSGRSTPVQGSSIVQSASLRPNQPLPYEASGAFVLEAACNLAASSPTSADPALLWSLVAGHAITIVSAPGHYHSLQVERAVVTIFRMVKFATSSPKLREELFLAFDQINGLPVEYRTTIATQVTAGLEAALRNYGALATSKTEWSIVLTMLAVYGNARSAQAVQYAMRAVHNLISINANSETKAYGLSLDNFTGTIALLRDYARAADALRFDGSQAGLDFPQARKTLTEKKALKEYEEACQTRGPEAVVAIEQLRVHIPRLAEQGHFSSLSQAWNLFWIPLMSAIAVQYTNPHRPTRQTAVTHLQRAVLASELLSLPGVPASAQDEFETAHALFNTIIFPTLHELLKAETFQIDPSNESGGMQEVRIRSCNLLCKVYLHYLNQLTGHAIQGELRMQAEQRYQQLWLVVLDFFDRFMHSGKRDQLTEATPENLKNILLVMNAAGVLVAPSTDGTADNRSPEQKMLFDQTFERIQRFLPRLKDEIFPSLNVVDAETRTIDERRPSELATERIVNANGETDVADTVDAQPDPASTIGQEEEKDGVR